MMQQFQWTAWCTLAAVSVYLWTGIEAGRARTKYKVAAPCMDGPPGFLCAQRVQANTLEQMAAFLPALFLCAVYLGDLWAAGLGLLWCLGRIDYALSYYQDPAKRSRGFSTAAIANAALMAGAAWGLCMH